MKSRSSLAGACFGLNKHALNREQHTRQQMLPVECMIVETKTDV